MQEKPLASQSPKTLQKTGFAKAPFRLRPRTQKRSLRPKTHERRSDWKGHCTPVPKFTSLDACLETVTKTKLQRGDNPMPVSTLAGFELGSGLF